MITDEMIAYESAGSREDSRWERWVKALEELLGHDLDGDQEADGYSLDSALDAFKAGQSPRAHLGVIRERKALIAKAGAAAKQQPTRTCCQDCGNETPRGGHRTRCKRCGSLVCNWCFHHVHTLHGAVAKVVTA